MIGTRHAIAHIAQAHRARHVLQFAIAIGGAGETVKRMVGDIELHHALAQLGELFVLRMHHHAVFGRRGAGGGRAAPPLNFHQAHAARAKRLQHIGGAELWNGRAHLHRRRHDRCAFRHSDRYAVNGQGYCLCGHADRRAVIEFFNESHGCLLNH